MIHATTDGAAPMPDLVPVCELPDACAAASAVALVHVHGGGATGTGFLLDGDLLATAAHVLPSPEAAARATVTLGFRHLRDGGFATFAQYELDPASWYAADLDRDLAVVRMRASGESPSKRWGALSIGDAKPAVGARVQVIQHARGGPQRVARAPGFVLSCDGACVTHDVATEAGASGAPLLDAQWNLLGMHLRTGDDRDTRERQAVPAWCLRGAMPGAWAARASQEHTAMQDPRSTPPSAPHAAGFSLFGPLSHNQQIDPGYFWLTQNGMLTGRLIVRNGEEHWFLYNQKDPQNTFDAWRWVGPKNPAPWNTVTFHWKDEPFIAAQIDIPQFRAQLPKHTYVMCSPKTIP